MEGKAISHCLSLSSPIAYPRDIDHSALLPNESISTQTALKFHRNVIAKAEHGTWLQSTGPVDQYIYMVYLFLPCSRLLYSGGLAQARNLNKGNGLLK